MEPALGRLFRVTKQLFRRKTSPNNWIAAVSAEFRVKRAKTPANRRGGGNFRVQEIFGGFRFCLTASRQVGARGRAPSRGRFRLTQYGILHFDQSVTTFASRTPLPPFNFFVSERTATPRRQALAAPMLTVLESVRAEGKQGTDCYFHSAD